MPPPIKRKRTSTTEPKEDESQGDNVPASLTVNERALLGNYLGTPSPSAHAQGHRAVTYYFEESGDAVEETKVERREDSNSVSADLFDSLLDDMEAAINTLGSSFHYQPLSIVCSSCQRIVDALSQVDMEISSENDWKNLELGNADEDSSVLLKRASEGCAVCRERLRERSMLKKVTVRANSGDEVEEEDPLDQITIKAQWEDGKVSKSSHWLAVGDTDFHLIRTSGIISVPSMGDMITMNCMPLLKEWIHRCCSSHEKCQRKKAKKAPSRLVFVGNEKICLEVDTDRVECLRYATLSHCWGHTEFETLKKGNLDSFKTRIPAEALSRTFLDAISVARALEIDYIWIDSLCIIQDSEDDWKTESAKMATIYGGSTLNIAASAASDGHGGLFFDRNEHWQCLLQLGKQDAKYCCFPESSYIHDVQQSNLASRGWTLQERLLSTRTVFFARTQVYWECDTREACEQFPSGHPSNILGEFGKRRVQTLYWEEIVGDYSRTTVTFSTDKLVAISGLARAIQLQTGDDYMAGLWRTSFLRDLCWETENVKASSDISLDSLRYRAPSWSWASLNVPVEFQSGRYPSIAFYVLGYPASTVRLSRVDMVLSGDDPLGAVESANLRLSTTFLIHLELVVREDGSRALSSGETEEELAEEADDEIDKINLDRTGQQLGKLWFLPVMNYSHAVYGLIMEATGQSPGQYRRVGLYIFSQWFNSKVESAFDTEKCRPQEEDCLEIVVSDDGATGDESSDDEELSNDGGSADEESSTEEGKKTYVIEIV